LILFSTPQLFASTPVAPAVPGSLDVQVADASGGAITDAIVLVQREEAAAVTASATSLGRYHLEGLRPGHYVVTVAKPGFASWSKNVDVEAGRTLSIAITLNTEGLSEHVTVEGASPYVPASVISGTRVPVHPLDLPQTVDAVPSALIRAQSALSMQDALVNVPGVTPFIMPNEQFYRIDTALVVPQLDTAGWKLKVHGMVEREVTIDWATLLSKPMQDCLVTLMCVSNEVGGNLTGNAVWTGWPVRELLKMAGPGPGADMVLSTSSDGWAAGTPLSALTDDRHALLAIAMNGQPLPFEHGFPVRMVVPGLYGYVSATKWVTDLKVTTFAADEGYWTPRGWSALGPVKTESRIDVPRSGDRVSAGKVAVAGIAWAQHRGITAVQVRVDDGPWQAARLAEEPSVDSWRQWVLPWQAVKGNHTITVRATDSEGVVQTPTQAPPEPDGATGWHSITVNVG
jgi:DMSO/TMAO reductase YedYZ molybdopterin-dependent catalytic subunit